MHLLWTKLISNFLNILYQNRQCKPWIKILRNIIYVVNANNIFCKIMLCSLNFVATIDCITIFEFRIISCQSYFYNLILPCNIYERHLEKNLIATKKLLHKLQYIGMHLNLVLWNQNWDINLYCFELEYKIYVMIISCWQKWYQ